MKISQLSVLALLAVAAPSAFAQTAPGGGATAGSSTTDASTVTNVGSTLATDPTTTVDTSITTTDTSSKGEMANTGGEPELMLLAGLALASGGLLLRRKVGSQSV